MRGSTAAAGLRWSGCAAPVNRRWVAGLRMRSAVPSSSSTGWSNRPMAQNREAMADLVAILDARRADYARAQAELDTSGDTVEQSCVKLARIVASCTGGGKQ